MADELRQSLRGLNRPHIRVEKPGYAEAYYDLAEQLAGSVAAVLDATNLLPRQVQGGPGETGANVRLIFKDASPDASLMLRLNIWDGELFASNVFYERARAGGINTPRVVHFDASHRVVPYDFQIITMLPGQPLTHFPPSLHRRAGAQVGQALRHVHAVSVEGFGAPLTDGRWSNDTWLGALREYYGAGLSPSTKRALFSAKEIEQLEQLTFENPRLNLPTPSLIHGDVGHGNGLFKLRGDALTLTGLIDPGSMIGGDPLFDLMASEDEFGVGLFEAYTQASPLSEAQQARFTYLKLLMAYWVTCWQFDTHRDFVESRNQTLNLLEVISK